VDDLSKRLAALTPEQRKLLELRTLKDRGHPTQELEAVAHATASREAIVSDEDAEALKKRRANTPMQFSIYHFSGDGMLETANKYQLLFETATFADQHGFAAIWTPERHFQDFGGLYPNPAVLSAAIAAMTSHVGIRAGSVVFPLHNPIRIAEEWSVVDNISNGRIGISCASGWHPGDFVLAPERYAQRKEIMLRSLEIVKRLWRGEPVAFPGIDGQDMEVRLLPRPVQAELPLWVTSSGNPQTWVKAGEIGAHVLAALIGQSITDLKQKIDLYRVARAQNGHDPQQGCVTLMLHTFLGENNEIVKEQVRAPLTSYLQSYLQQQEHLTTQNYAPELKSLGKRDKDAIAAHAFERYFTATSLLGTPDKCALLVDQLADIGVNEITCLVDFGLDHDTVMAGLPYLNELRQRYR
jgi:natural product biosynthesis luciferase-like monooxygenase protein